MPKPRLMDEKGYAAHQAKFGRKAGEHLLRSARTVIALKESGVSKATAEEFGVLMAGAKKRSKFGNVKTVVDGIKHDSKREAKRYRELGLLLKGGQIDFLARQVRFGLPGGVEYVADFVYGVCDGPGHGNGKILRAVVEDAKGVRNRVYINKAKQMKSEHGIDVVEV